MEEKLGSEYGSNLLRFRQEVQFLQSCVAGSGGLHWGIRGLPVSEFARFCSCVSLPCCGLRGQGARGGLGGVGAGDKGQLPRRVEGGAGEVPPRCRDLGEPGRWLRARAAKNQRLNGSPGGAAWPAQAEPARPPPLSPPPPPPSPRAAPRAANMAAAAVGRGHFT